jgi:hypothetical protein
MCDFGLFGRDAGSFDHIVYKQNKRTLSGRVFSCLLQKEENVTVQDVSKVALQL